MSRICELSRFYSGSRHTQDVCLLPWQRTVFNIMTTMWQALLFTVFLGMRRRDWLSSWTSVCLYSIRLVVYISIELCVTHIHVILSMLHSYLYTSLQIISFIWLPLQPSSSDSYIRHCWLTHLTFGSKLYCGGGGGEDCFFLRCPQVSPARPSGKGKVRTKYVTLLDAMAWLGATEFWFSELTSNCTRINWKNKYMGFDSKGGLISLNLSWENLHEKHAVATWILGTIRAFA
jgi:hypothetical protein